ncbi:hypothetical protein CLOSTMETH_00217 [[Clostridium] methylpentosum DSM 5476]|uniref:Uncharacterized protein n=1 Tax=[Clostridium] methylpentosum DSM 5476 TaxID=537013 RepID=C0E8S2_9FIRM|nr:hypothetical protein CLOSTMETH_00217 [[Clostridium] methylpentosum DSM 5476]
MKSPPQFIWDGDCFFVIENPRLCRGFGKALEMSIKNYSFW